MARCSRKPSYLLPRQWPARAKSAVLHAISLATTAATIVRSRALDSRRLIVRRSAEVDVLREEVALLRDELALKDSRMDRLAAHRRPHFKPLDRMAILELRCRRGWTVEQTAERFHVEPRTLAAWLRRIDEPGDRPLVQTVSPVNRYPDFVAYLVQRLRTLCPTMGRRRVADVLARAGLQLSSSTVRRLSTRDLASDDPTPGAASRRQLVAKAPHDVWGLDLTVVPAHGGFWTLLRPWAWLQRWPFCFWVAAVVDWHSRRAVGFAVFSKQPTGRDMTALLRGAMARAGTEPQVVVTDRGVQFDLRTFRRWCGRHGIQQRFGAVGRPGSIALVERFIRSLKDECTRRLVLPMRPSVLRQELALYTHWYNAHRPHQALGGRTPDEVCRGDRITRRRSGRKSGAEQSPPASSALPQPAPRLEIRFLEGRRHLPLVHLRQAA
jgi:putative transposase